MTVEAAWWGDGAEHHDDGPNAAQLRKIPNRDALLKVYCDTERHLVAVVKRDRSLVTSNGTTHLDQPREITCRCSRKVTMTDPAKLMMEVDPTRLRTVMLHRIAR